MFEQDDGMKQSPNEFQTETITKFLENQIKLRNILDTLIH
jgi:hypothetical protein